MPKLTKRLLDSTPKPSRDVAISDDTLPGFRARFRPSGATAFEVRYRTRGGAWRVLTLGRYGQPLTVDEARRMARDVLARVERGADPVAERRLVRIAETVEQLTRRYLAEVVDARLKPRTAEEFRRLAELRILPKLGRAKAGEVDRATVSRWHHAQRKTPTSANRALAVLSGAFAFGERLGIVAANPCRGLVRFVERSRERLLTGEEVARLGEVLARAEAEATEHPSVLLALRLLILTGCRRSEITGLRWAEVDLDARALRLADSKTGRRVIPLNAPALALLAEARDHANGSPWVCPSARRVDAKRDGSPADGPGKGGDGPLSDLERPWRRIRDGAGIPDVRLHDLRHLFGSRGASLGLGLPIVGALLGHRQASTTARYIHHEVDPLAVASERIGAKLAEQLAGSSARTGAEVVEFRRGGA